MGGDRNVKVVRAQNDSLTVKFTVSSRRVQALSGLKVTSETGRLSGGCRRLGLAAIASK